MLRTLGLLCILAALAGAVEAEVITVALDGSGDHEDLQAAVDAAGDGDEIRVGPGEHLVSSPLDLNPLHDPEDPESPPLRNLIVRSEEGPERTTLRVPVLEPDPLYIPVVVFAKGEDGRTVLDGFSITGGRDAGLSVTGGSSPRIERCIIRGNTGLMAAGVFCGEEATPTLVDCEITENISDEWGGGLGLWDRAHPRLVGCRIVGNFAYDYGGGVLCNRDALATLERCVVSSNTAENGGGFASFDGGVTLDRTRVIGNMARRAGGAVYLDTEGDLVAVNTVIYGNRAETSGIVHALDDSDAFLDYSTVAGNEGEPFCGDSLLAFRTCIVDIEEPQGEVPCLLLDGCLVGEDPRFERAPVPRFDRLREVRIDPLVREVPDYFDEDPDLRIREGSPAIDMGDPAGAPEVDLAGLLRPCGSGVDAGAHEHAEDGCAVEGAPFRRGDANSDGGRDIADAVFALGHLFLGDAAPLCLDAADSDDSGALNLTDAVYTLNWLFLGGPEPAEPFADCGPDPTADELACELATPGCG